MSKAVDPRLPTDEATIDPNDVELPLPAGGKPFAAFVRRRDGVEVGLYAEADPDDGGAALVALYGTLCEAVDHIGGYMRERNAQPSGDRVAHIKERLEAGEKSRRSVPPWFRRGGG